MFPNHVSHNITALGGSNAFTIGFSNNIESHSFANNTTHDIHANYIAYSVANSVVANTLSNTVSDILNPIGCSYWKPHNIDTECVTDPVIPNIVAVLRG